MKYLQIIFLLILSFVTKSIYADDNYKAYFSDKNQQKLSKEILDIMHEFQVPGASIAIVDSNGVVWQRGFGFTKSGGNHSVTPLTLFGIESQTKMFTSLGVLRAVQAGQLNLNVPISEYLPNLKVYSVFQANPVKLITLKHLLSHTAGFSHEAPVGNNYNSSATFSEHIKSILDGVWLQFPVGYGYNYSNVGMDLAGYILQVSSNIPYEKYMEKEVLEPLEMNHSTFSIDTYEQNPDHAQGLVPGLKEAPVNHAIIPAGGLYSNVVDMSHYLEFQLNNGVYHEQRILNQALLKTMLTIPYPQTGQLEGSALGIWKGTRLNTTYYSHLGRGFGFASCLEWYPQYHIGIVVLTNKYDTNNVDIKIAHLLIDNFINKQFDNNKRSIEAEIQGEYVSNGGSIRIVKDSKNNQLFLTGDLNFGSIENNIVHVNDPLVYIGNDEFNSENTHEKYRFIERGITGVKTLERISDGYMWFYNQSPSDPVGQEEKDWKRFVGDYSLYGYGPVTHFSVHIDHGYLYINGIRLMQKRDNVFITPNGQVLIFEGKHLNWAGLSLVK